MGIAILTTLIGHAPSGVGAWFLVLLGLGIGGGAGAFSMMPKACGA
jgi:NAD(P) transhydrogenase subunit beta